MQQNKELDQWGRAREKTQTWAGTTDPKTLWGAVDKIWWEKIKPFLTSPEDFRDEWGGFVKRFLCLYSLFFLRIFPKILLLRPLPSRVSLQRFLWCSRFRQVRRCARVFAGQTPGDSHGCWRGNNHFQSDQAEGVEGKFEWQYFGTGICFWCLGMF